MNKTSVIKLLSHRFLSIIRGVKYMLSIALESIINAITKDGEKVIFADFGTLFVKNNEKEKGSGKGVRS